jgi:amidase
MLKFTLHCSNHNYQKSRIMQRRSFLRRGALSGISVAAGAILPSAAHSVPVPEGFAGDDFPLIETSIADLQRQMSSGRMSARSIAELYLKRIRAIDREGPKLNAVIELNPDALAIADRMDRERKSGKLRGPMHGIPVLIKDNIDTGDRMMTTAGSLALEGNIASVDAPVVARLREAGAVILGKTNLSEWANFRSTRSSSGWSSRGGQTRNPFVLNRNPSGSSSGSGAAVSANLCAVAVGTETDGSIISPSSCSGIVGIKPTIGLVSRTGIIPISRTQDTAGPMARNVRDAAILLSAMAGPDPSDPATADSQGKLSTDYTVFLKDAGLRGRRIGVEKSHMTGNPFVVAMYEEAIRILKAQGAEVVEVELLRLIAPNGVGESNVLQYEFKDGLNSYLAKSNAKVRSLEDVIRFNSEHADKVMPWFRQETLEVSQKKGGLDSREYLDALKLTKGAGKVIDDLMREQRLDAISGVSAGIPGCTDPLNGDYGTGFYFSRPAAIAGYPHITVPMGHAGELPAGLSFIGSAWQEGPLLSMAYAFEQASRKRRAPRFIPYI